jgi:heavy metal sensor kinase
MRWYVLAMATALLIFACSSSLILYWYLRSQLYHYMVVDLETVEGLLYYALDGRLDLHEDYYSHPGSKNVQERLLEVINPAGEVLFRNDKLADRYLGGQPLSGEGESGYVQRSTRLSDGTRVFMVSRSHLLNGRPMIIRVAYAQGLISRSIGETLAAFMLSLPTVLIVTALVGYGLAKRSLDPLSKMAVRADQITAERLHDRLPVDDTGEIGQVARAFNNTLARLEHSFDQLKRFTSDASHELRTPLTLIRSVGEVGLQTGRTKEEYREIIGSMLEEVSQLSQLVDSLLTMSRADAGEIEIRPTVFRALDALREAASLIEILAEEKEQELLLGGDEDAFVLADRLLLRQALLNIIHNAVKYSPRGTSISVSVLRDATNVVLQITDAGSGIPDEARARVFDRFYRVDAARSRDAGGVGLGLSIAKWAIQAQGGYIHVVNNPDRGCTFRIAVPLHSAPPESVKKNVPESQSLPAV